MPALLRLLLSPTEQLRELQLALATAAGAPANAQARARCLPACCLFVCTDATRLSLGPH